MHLIKNELGDHKFAWCLKTCSVMENAPSNQKCTHWPKMHLATENVIGDQKCARQPKMSSATENVLDNQKCAQQLKMHLATKKYAWWSKTCLVNKITQWPKNHSVTQNPSIWRGGRSSIDQGPSIGQFLLLAALGFTCWQPLGLPVGSP